MRDRSTKTGVVDGCCPELNTRPYENNTPTPLLSETTMEPGKVDIKLRGGVGSYVSLPGESECPEDPRHPRHLGERCVRPRARGVLPVRDPSCTTLTRLSSGTPPFPPESGLRIAPTPLSMRGREWTEVDATGRSCRDSVENSVCGGEVTVEDGGTSFVSDSSRGFVVPRQVWGSWRYTPREPPGVSDIGGICKE